MTKIINIVNIINIIHQQTNLMIELKNLRFFIHNFGNNLIENCSNKNEFNKIKKETFPIILKRVKLINKEITNFNKYLKKYIDFWNFEFIDKIDLKKINFVIQNLEFEKNLLKESLGTEAYLIKRIKDLERRPPRGLPQEENFYLKINEILNETSISLDKITLCFLKNALKFPSSKELQKSKFGEFNVETNCLFSLGYPYLGLFIIGRTLELIILDFMFLLVKNKKINKTIKQVKDMTAEDRLNFLKGKWITEKDYHKISSIKFDRNIVAHYNSKKEFLEARKDAELDIKLAFNLIEKIYLKIIKYQSSKI